jgi:DNA polymerase I
LGDGSKPGKPVQVEECSFNSIFGTFEGHRIFASRKVAEKDLFPCGDRDESRFSPDFEIPLSILGMEVAED